MTLALNGLNLATLLSLITGVLIPAVSAYLTPSRLPKEVIGVATLLLSALSGFCSEWAKAGSGFDWRTAALTSLGALITATVGYVVAFHGNPTAKLHASGVGARKQPSAL